MSELIEKVTTRLLSGTPPRFAIRPRGPLSSFPAARGCILTFSQPGWIHNERKTTTKRRADSVALVRMLVALREHRKRTS